MQTADLNVDLTENASKTVDASTECRILDDELTTLRQQVINLNHTVVNLENTLQIKDVQMANMHRDNERLTAELKKHQRCNRNLKQQLDDERFFYQREKNHFREEMERHKSRCANCALKFHQQERKGLERARDILREENRSLKDELVEKSETIYNLCIKFLRMKHAKDTLRRKLDQLLREHLQVMAEMMERLDEARQELNIIVSEKFQEPLPLSKAKFLQVMQRNTRLIHENAALKVEIQQLTQNVEKLKSNVQKPKTINVDARIISKLIACNTRKCSRETLSTECESKSGKMTSSKCVNTDYCQSIDYSDDTKKTEQRQSDGSQSFRDSDFRRQAQSVSETIPTNLDYSPVTSTDQTNSSERNTEVRDVWSNT